MNVFIPGYKPTVQDPKKDVSQLPKELMSKMPEKTGTTVPGGVPEANMSRMPTAPQTMSVSPAKPAQSVNPIVNPLGANITGVPTAVNPIMQQTAKETLKAESPAPIQPGVPTGKEPTEEDYQAASDYFDTIELSQDEVDFIDQSVSEGYEFKDAMLYIANKRQNEAGASWEDEPVQEKKSGFLDSLAELLRINEDTGKLLPEEDDSEVTRVAKPIINDMTTVGKFLLNIPADTVDIAGDLIDVAMNPWQSAKGLFGLLGVAGQEVAKGTIAAVSPKTKEEVGKDMTTKAKAVSGDQDASGLSKFFANTFLQNEAISEAVTQEIINNFGTQEQFRKTIVENPVDVLTTIIPIAQSLKGMKIAGTASKATQYAQFIKGLQEAKSSINVIKPAWLESKAIQKLGGSKLPRTAVDPRISVTNKLGEMIGNPELAAKTFADLDNAEIGAIKNIGPAKVQEMITELNTIDQAAMEGGGRGNIYNKLSTEVMEGVGKRSKEASEMEKIRKTIVKETDASFTKEEMLSIFDEAISKQGITRKTSDKGSTYAVVGEGAIKESELSKLDDLEREIFRTDKDAYTAEEIDARIKNLQKNLYDKNGLPKNGSESVTKMTEGIIAKLNDEFKNKMPPEYAEAKEKMSQILTDRRRILKELKEEDNTIALGRDIDKMDEAELGKLIEDSIAGNRMALFLRRLASNTTTGGDPQSLAETVKRFTGIDVENRALALRALAKATGKTQIANELGGLLATNKSTLDKALGLTAKAITPSGEKTIKELASRGKAKDIPYEPKTVKYEGKKVEKPTANKFVKTVTEEKVEPSTVDYARAKGMIERPTMKTDARKASNLTAARHDRRGVIVTPQGEVKALPPAQPVWVQQMDGQYSDPQGYLKALQRDILDENLQLKEVSDFGKTTSTDELNYLLNDRNVQTKESFYDLILKRNEMKNDVGFTRLLDDAYRNNIDEVQNYYMGDADYKLFTSPVQIGAIRSMFGDDLAKDLIDGYRYMEKNGYEDVVGAVGKSGKENKAIKSFISAVEEYNNRKNISKDMELTPDEAYNIIKDVVSDIQKKQKKFQTLAERYEVAPEISVAQAREIMGKDFPIKIVDKLQTPEGRKAMGVYYQGAIEIAKNPVSTTGYHEAFHAWLDIYGPSRLRDAAYKQIERTVGITNKIDIEEHLAESFAMWKLSGRGASGALKQFFQAIWEDIKSLIGKQDKVVDLFRNVGKKGRMNEMSKNRMLQDIAYESPNGITTKILEELQGRTSVSKQFIENLLRRDDVRQVEKDIFAEKLRNFGDKVDIGELSDQIRAELLPLKRKSVSGEKNEILVSKRPRYDFVSLPEESRGKIDKYREIVYESPITTSAGQTHWAGDTNKYFGHTRVEDMADGKTRRVIEVQSDLYQKGNIDKEMIPYTLTSDVENALYDLSNYNWKSDKIPDIIKKYGLDDRAKQIILEKLKTKSQSSIGTEGMNTMKKFAEEVGNIKGTDKRIAEVQKLKQYTDPTAHFRMVREEIVTAAKDGRTKLQFPTGETAMKVEGLGTQQTNWIDSDGLSFNSIQRPNARDINNRQPKVGEEVFQGTMQNGWVITETLGEGKFKAVPSDYISERMKSTGESLEEVLKKAQNSITETFDISGKVDTQNPIYKFYENEMQKYLKRFGAQRVTDDKGVEWFEVPIKEEYGKRPVQAFQSTPDIIVGKGKVFYHGTTKQNHDSILKNGWNTKKNTKGFAEDPDAMYVSTSTEANSDHSAGTYGDHILKVEPKGDVKFLDMNSRKWVETAGSSKNMKETKEWHKKLAKEGYDGIMESNGEIIIFNPDKFKITSQSETYSRPTSSFFNKSAVIGEGTEGEVRDLGNFAVKKINNSSVDTEMIDKIKTLIKSPNKDYIEYYDIWEDAGNSYISMQKLTKDQLRQPFIDMGKVDSRGDWMEAIFNAAVNNEKFPIKYEKIKNNPFVKFLYYISRKYPNISDITPENMAVINGEYKLFDSW